MASGIYKITDTRNGKIYIGRAVDLKTRKWRHFCYTHPEDYKSSSLVSEINMDIHKAMIESHNKNDFVFEVVEECPIEKLDEKEEYYIQMFNSKENGYNSTDGGKTYAHSTGEDHYNHKITKNEADKIKILLLNGKTVKEIKEQIPSATIGIISSINNGRTWKDNNITYPISRMNGVIKFSNEEVLDIRIRRANGETTVSLAQRYNTTTSTISSIRTGLTHTDLPVYQTEFIKRNIFSEEQVNFYRQEYYINNVPIKTLYENSDFQDLISYDGFKCMVNGTSYKQYKVYDKQIKKDTLVDRNERIRQLEKEGMLKKDIAIIVGCSERTVYRALSKDNKFE